MLKINNPQTIPFDPETDVGYALDRSSDLYFFNSVTVPRAVNVYTITGRGIFKMEFEEVLDYGPFTRFQGTATIGNDS